MLDNQPREGTTTEMDAMEARSFPFFLSKDIFICTARSELGTNFFGGNCHEKVNDVSLYPLCTTADAPVACWGWALFALHSFIKHNAYESLEFGTFQYVGFVRAKKSDSA